MEDPPETLASYDVFRQVFGLASSGAALGFSGGGASTGKIHDVIDALVSSGD